jgi:hypothetical protein
MAEMLLGSAAVIRYPPGVAQRGMDEGEELQSFEAEVRLLKYQMRQFGQMESLTRIEDELSCPLSRRRWTR